MDKEKNKNLYWKLNLTIVGSLLVIWFMVSFGAGILFSENNMPAPNETMNQITKREPTIVRFSFQYKFLFFSLSIFPQDRI
jgi:hypothetical protein